MCNLYRMSRSNEEVARLFGVTGTNADEIEEVFPRSPGFVVSEGRLRSMIWGFPLAQRSKRTGELLQPRPVNNARTDKLDSFMWRYSFAERRCLIPLTAWAEAEGPKGAMTRTWMSLPDQPVFACAGVWRGSEEWGDCYSMVMTDAVGDAAEVHDRMPVILGLADYDRWLHTDSIDALSLCIGYTGEIEIDRTAEPWRRANSRDDHYG